MAEGEERTEAATPRRRREARKQGQAAKSQELASLAVLMALVLAMPAIGGYAASAVKTYFVSVFLHLKGTPITDRGLHTVGTTLLIAVLRAVAPLALTAMGVGIIANMAQTGPMLALERLKPDLNRLNPIKGMQRFVSVTGLVELLKSVAKMGLVGWVGYSTVRAAYPLLLMLALANVHMGLAALMNVIQQLLQRVAGVMLIMAALDYAYQRYNFEKQIRMTRYEVRQEFKQNEGDPMLKSRLRARMRQMAKTRMMSNVPTADVVITNPTHFAIALKYESATMKAPVVVAKGQDLIALKIRELAQMNDVPIVENPPLARALFKSAALDHEIPPGFYAAVAEVMAFVYQINEERRRRQSYAGSVLS